MCATCCSTKSETAWCTSVGESHDESCDESHKYDYSDSQTHMKLFQQEAAAREDVCHAE